QAWNGRSSLGRRQVCGVRAIELGNELTCYCGRICTSPTTSSGYAELLRWTGQYADLVQVGIEGTGIFGAGLSPWLHTRYVTFTSVFRRIRHAGPEPTLGRGFV